MKYLAAVIAGLVMTAAPAAFAQDKPAVDPVRLELAKKLIEVSGGKKNAELMVNQIYGSMDSILGKSLPADKQRLFHAIQRDMQTELLNLIPAIIDESVEIYARNLTEKELKEMIAWQSSESGQSINRKLPAITQDIIKAEIPYIQAMMPRLMERVVDHACEEAKCSADERRQVAAVMAQATGMKPS